jgi:hypothetical protein
MIEQTLRSFCESRYRWLIVIGGTVAVGLVLIVPLVDVYSAERNEKTELLDELASAHTVAETITHFEGRVAEKTTQLKALEARTVDEETLPALRTRLVELSRETGCSLRRVNVGAMSSRPWHQGDDPIAVATTSTTKTGALDTGFSLQWRPVTVSLSGTNQNLCSLLDRMEADGMLMHTKNFEMHPASEGRKILNLDMEIWYFNLARGN